MSAAALANARNSGGSSTTVQTAQLHPQQPQQAFNRTSIGLSSNNNKRTEDMIMSENGKNGMNAARSPSTQAAVEKKGPESETQEECKASKVQKTLPAAAASKGKDDDGNKMYPDDLRSILIEVSKGGTCSSLSWMGEVSEQTTAVGEQEARRLPQVGGPPRKKQRNGLHHSTTTSRTGVKRSLSLRAGSHHLSPAHSSRTSGSEMEEMSQDDSEGTVSSEFSMDKARAQHLLNGFLNGLKNQKQNASTSKSAETAVRPPAKYTSLRQVFRLATDAVLDHFHQKRGGYKLSPAEQKRNFISVSTNQKQGEKVAADPGKSSGYHTPEEVFNQRKQRLLNLVGDTSVGNKEGAGVSAVHVTGPPFTIQRIAEVLLMPERYYTQTHKLCNCLEKLLLVTSSIRAFGGSTGGSSSQSRREEQEIAALADERGRLLSEYRRRRRQRTMSASSFYETHAECSERNEASTSPPTAASSEGKMHASEVRWKEDDGDAEPSKDELQKEDLLEAARASLRSKFDHVGIDPHSAVATANREQQSGNRSMTNSPPPPNISGAGHGIGLAGHAHGGLLRPHHDQEHQHQGSPNSLVVRTPSPIMFKTTPEGGSSPKKASPTPIHPTHQNLQLLQMHHAAVLAGVSPFELMGLNGSGHAAPVPPAAGVGTLSGSVMPAGLKEMDVECRSPASSDLDSESDDVSFDDSASDRSDGSDSNEPAANSAVARTLALNRVQQQQQQQQKQQQFQPQRRVLGSTSTSAFISSIGQRVQLQQPQTNEATQAAAPVGARLHEAEYQSGDSIDSLRAEDSDSSSDMAD